MTVFISTPYEKDSGHGNLALPAFIAFRCAVASSSLWPPDRKTMPGTVAGTVRFRQSTVASATCWTLACWAHSCPEITMLALSTRCS